jgi:undecaprenyl-diphosphatase
LGLSGFDYGLVRPLNSMSGRFWIVDQGVFLLTGDMFSMLLPVTLIWYVWFDTEETDARARIGMGVIMSFVAGILSRVLQLTLPTHLRPLHDPALHFRPPLGVDPTLLNNWSSFPSDHAAVLFGLAAVVFIVDRRLGWLAFALAAVLNIVRLYLGFHFPTDIIGGAALGIVFVGLTQRLRLCVVFQRIMAAESSHRALFYAASFYLCFGVTTLFDDYRSAAVYAVHALKSIVLH